MHGQSRPRVDLDHDSALIFQPLRDVAGHDVETGHVQTHDLSRQGRVGYGAGVNLIGHVDGQVVAVLDHNRHAGRRHAFGTVTLTFELHLRGLVVDPDPAQGTGFKAATPGVGVELFVNELGHGSLAVADDGGGFSAGSGHQLAPHHQQAVFGALGEFLDNHAAAFVARRLEGGPHLSLAGQTGEHAAGVVAIARLHYHGRADLLGRLPGIVRVADQAPLGNRNATRTQQVLGQLLVLRDRFSHRTGAVGLGRPDAALLGALAKLDQAAFVEPAHGNATGVGRSGDGGRAGAQAHAVGQLAQFANFLGHVVGLVVDGGQHQFARGEQAGARQPLVAVAHHDPIHTLFHRLTGTAVPHRRAGQVLQFDGDVFQNMRRVGSVAQTLKETAAFTHAAAVLDHGRQPRHQPIIETGYGIRRTVLEVLEVHPCLQHRVPRPDVRAAQGEDLSDLHG